MMTPLVLCLILSCIGGQATAQWQGNEINGGVVLGHETSDHCALCCASQAPYTTTCAQESQVLGLQNTVQQLQAQIQLMQTSQGGPRDCSDLLKEGYDSSGIYTIYPFSNDVQESGKSVGVFCDMGTDSGGWTVFQRRQEGSEDFYRGWADYKTGFGKLDGEFWLGNNNLHQLTSQAQYELRVDLEDFEGNSAYAQYQVFSVGSEVDYYRLTVGGYNGTAGDSMTAHHNGRPFSTWDRDYDESPTSCAQAYTGAWWYAACHDANLNGLYLAGSQVSNGGNGVNWLTWKGYFYSLKHTEMKIRPIHEAN